MKIRNIFMLLAFVFFLASCQMFSDDPVQEPESFDYRGVWLGTMESLPSEKNFSVQVEIASQTLYGNVTGKWWADFPDGKTVGIMDGTTRKGGIHFNLMLAIPNSKCTFVFDGNKDENDVIIGNMKTPYGVNCEGHAYGIGVLELKRQSK